MVPAYGMVFLLVLGIGGFQAAVSFLAWAAPLQAIADFPQVMSSLDPKIKDQHKHFSVLYASLDERMLLGGQVQTQFSLADIIALAGTAGAGIMAPPTSTRITARLKRVHGHVSPVNVAGCTPACSAFPCT